MATYKQTYLTSQKKQASLILHDDLNDTHISTHTHFSTLYYTGVSEMMKMEINVGYSLSNSEGWNRRLHIPDESPLLWCGYLEKKQAVRVGNHSVSQINLPSCAETECSLFTSLTVF